MRGEELIANWFVPDNMKLKTLKYDLRLLKGDPMLKLIMVVPFILWAIMQFAIPMVIEAVYEKWQLDLSPYYRQAGTFFLMLIPMMTGMVYGFILLDERDEGIIAAIAVTPLGKKGYLGLRLGIPVAVSFVLIVLYLYLLGITGELGPLQVLILSGITASQCLLLLLFLGAFASNKVMGMAISKGFGLLLLAPVLDYILPAPWNSTGAYSPLFWASRALLADSPPEFWLFAGIALLFHALLIFLLFTIFQARSD